jgi:lipoprotein-releasing system permease protein
MVQLKNANRAPQDSLAFEELFNHRARSWQEREKSNLQLFQALRVSAAIGVCAIIMLAGFGIFNVLTMSVLDKTKEISILRSMGYTQGDIAWIFILQGFMIATIGIVLGWALGAGLTRLVEFIPIQIRGILKADHFIVTWAWEHYALAAVLALASVLIASYVPARRAAQVRPVDVLRGTSN